MGAGKARTRTNHGVAANARRVADALTRLGPQTRGALAAELGVSRKTVTLAMERLNQLNSTKRDGDAVVGIAPEDAQLPEHIVKALSGKSGETPEVLTLGRMAGVVIGIEVGNSHLSTGLGDANSRLLGDPDIAEASHSIEGKRPQETFDQAAAMVAEQLERCGVRPSEVRGVTVSMPAPISTAGQTLSRSVLQPYYGTDVPASLRSSLVRIASLPDDVPVFPENDVDVLARGEQRYGRAFGMRNFVVIKCSGGIGSAIVSNDRIVRGRDGGGAGEIGHCPIKPQVLVERDGHIWSDLAQEPVCRCGCLGHLEAFAGGRALVERIRAREKGRRKSIPAKSSLSSQLDVVMGRALEGDGPHRQAVEDAAAMVGVAANVLFHVFNPRLLLITGKMSEMGELFLSGVQDQFNAQGTLYGKAKGLIALGTGVTTAERRRIGIRGATTAALRKTQPRLRYE